MTGEKEYREGYEKLNAEQRLAVDSIDGPVFVIAGPGTGKTQVLTLRIANILRSTDTPPESILALTYTESAASEMRARLTRVIGATARKVRIHTFHGFAESVIAQYPDSFPRIIGAHVATDIERAEIFDALLLETKVMHLRPFGDPLYYHYAVSNAIQTMKRENVTPENLRERIIEAEAAFEAMEGKVHEKGKYAGQMKGDYVSLLKKIEKTRDLLAIYEGYEAKLTELRRYDFEDIILEVEKALSEDAELRLQVQESLHYILADEHQDANRAQNALLELISGFFEDPNLFIVGDEKQAIYRFQGADLDNVHYFKTRFPNTRVIALVQNYRSSQTILDSALSLISNSPDERLSRVSLVKSTTRTEKPISLIQAASPEVEMKELAQNIQACLDEGVLPGEIAVLARRNRDVAYISRALMSQGILVSGGEEGNALHNRFVESLLRLLSFIAYPRDEHAVGVLTLPAFTLPAADVWRVTQEARKSKHSILSVLTSPEALERAQVSDVAQAGELAHTLTTLMELAAYERPAEVASKALQASGILPKILSVSDTLESLAAVRALLTSFEELARREHGALLPRALELMQLYEARGIPLAPRTESDSTRVKVMTVHRSKGREFARVFIPLLTESAWSTRSKPEHFYLPDILSGSAELEDERRLLYVAITRAKEHATLSYATARSDGRADALQVLVDDIDPTLLEVTESTCAPIDPLDSVSTDTSSDRPSEDDIQTLRAAFFAQGISPTAFNNYIDCHWKYFYVNLLRLPDIENKHMLYGTAIHEALHVYAEARKKGKDIGATGLMETFAKTLERSPLHERDIQELIEKGTHALPLWWEANHKTWPEHSRAELPAFGNIPYEKAPEGHLLLRGKLDRVDEVGGGVRVIDYKTGKPKSRNTLMGETKDADGNYYRQLTLYKLMLARSESPETMVEGVIEFVEPDDAGTLRAETFAISEDEMLSLEELITKSADEIATLSFWNTRCEDEECAWCKLRFS